MCNAGAYPSFFVEFNLFCLQVTLTLNHEKMENEVNSLRDQVLMEKSRYKKMQGDLHKELNIAFEENTKLTALLDGKVPKSRFQRFISIFVKLKNIQKV